MSLSVDYKLDRYFTRAGRDPLNGIDMTEREYEGQKFTAPSYWSDRAWKSLLDHIGMATADPALVFTRVAEKVVDDALRCGFVIESEAQILKEELAFLMATNRALPTIFTSEMPGGMVNLIPFYAPKTQTFDVAGLRQAVRILTTISAAPGRPVISWTNENGLFEVSNLSPDSGEAKGISGGLSGMIIGETQIVGSQLAHRNSSAKAEEGEKEGMVHQLESLKQRIHDLPAMSRVQPPRVEPMRWLTKAEDKVAEAVELVKTNGCLAGLRSGPRAFPQLEHLFDVEPSEAAPVAETAPSEPEMPAETPAPAQAERKVVAETSPEVDGALDEAPAAVVVAVPAAEEAKHEEVSEPAPTEETKEELNGETEMTSTETAQPAWKVASETETQEAKVEAPTQAVVAPTKSVMTSGATRRRASAFELMSDDLKIVIHTVEKDSGELEEVAVNSYAMKLDQRAMVDAFCQSLNIGLKSGVKIDSYADDIKVPGLIRDILGVLKAAYGRN